MQVPHTVFPFNFNQIFHENYVSRNFIKEKKNILPPPKVLCKHRGAYMMAVNRGTLTVNAQKIIYFITQRSEFTCVKSWYLVYSIKKNRRGSIQTPCAMTNNGLFWVPIIYPTSNPILWINCITLLTGNSWQSLRFNKWAQKWWYLSPAMDNITQYM